MNDIIKNTRNTKPLVHCITNYVTVNDCANVVLASGGSPIMADDKNEVEDITSICTTLVINIGTLNERTIESMIIAGKKANELSHPVILDPVGAGASKLRNETAMKLIDEVKFSVIRGNISEIKYLALGGGNTQGVDACDADMVTEDNLDSVISFAKSFSKKTGAVIAITGAIDIVADDKKAYVIKNGTAMMSNITGTGCMLSCVIGSFVGGNSEYALEATACAVSTMGLCGEMGQKKVEAQDSGYNSLRMHIIDNIGKIDDNILKEGAKIEIRE